MYIIKQLEREINQSLYSHYLKRFPELMSGVLPFKDVNDEKVDRALIILGNEHIGEMLRDIKLALNTDNHLLIQFESIVTNKLQLTLICNATVLSRAISNVSLPTKTIINQLKLIDDTACVVGGCVRDSLRRNSQPNDWDFVSSLDYDTLSNHFKKLGYDVKETGKEFLVLIVVIDGESFEIALFRKDGMYTDGRRPDGVETGTILEDAQRRDFTVNALYYRLSDDNLLDPLGTGIEDIQNCILKFVGKPKDRLEEDKLRMFRFYRFLDKGFEADSKSLKAVRDCWNDYYAEVTPDRARVEIEKMLKL